MTITQEEAEKFQQLLKARFPNAEFDIIAAPEAIALHFSINAMINIDLSIPLDDEARLQALGRGLHDSITTLINKAFPQALN